MACRYIKSKGEFIVYVTPGCPKAFLIHGVLVTSKIQCKECRRKDKLQEDV